MNKNSENKQKIANLQSQLLSISSSKVNNTIKRVAGSSTAMSAKNENAVKALMNMARTARNMKISHSLPQVPTRTRRKNRKSRKTRRSTRRN